MGGNPKPGLQIERTHLAWERTAFGYLAVVATLLFHTHDRLGPPRLTLALLAAALATAVFGIARIRGRITVDDADPARPVVRAPHLAVRLTGWGTAGLATLTVVAGLLGP